MKDGTWQLSNQDYRAFLGISLLLGYLVLLGLGRTTEAAAIGPWVGLMLERYFAKAGGRRPR